MRVGARPGDPNPRSAAHRTRRPKPSPPFKAWRVERGGGAAGSVGINAPGRGDRSPRGESSDRISGFKSRSGRAKGGDEVRERSRSLVSADPARGQQRGDCDLGEAGPRSLRSERVDGLVRLWREGRVLWRPRD